MAKPLIASNIKKMYVASAFFETMFFIPIMIPFLMDLGLNMQQILTIEGAFSLTVVLLEIPSGYFADIFGRKLSIVLGSLSALIGITFFVLGNTFWDFLVAEVILGIGISFVSGAREALLYDSLVEMKKENEYKKTMGNMFFVTRIASTVASISGGLMAAVFLRLPFYLTIIPYALWFLISLTYVEPKRHKMEFEHWEHFKLILKDSFINNKKLRYIIIYSAVSTGFFIIAFWFYQDYMRYIDFPIKYFGIIIAATSLISGFGGKYAKEFEKTIGPKVSLLAIPIVPALCWISMAAFDIPAALIFAMIACFFWGFSTPIFSDAIQKITSADRRATVNSLTSFLRRIIFVALAPMLGAVSDIYTVKTALIITAILVLTLSGISALTLRRVKVL